MNIEEFIMESPLNKAVMFDVMEQWERLTNAEGHFDPEAIEIELSGKKKKAESFARGKRTIKGELERLIERMGKTGASGDVIEKANRLYYGSLDNSEEEFPAIQVNPDAGMDSLQIDDPCKYEPVEESPEAAALRRIASELRAGDKIRLGEFCASTEPGRIGTITLYIRAIEEYAYAADLDPDLVRKAVTAHEVFHAYHYSLFKEIGAEKDWFRKESEKERTLVLESLASAYEWEYCAEEFLSDKKRLYGFCKYCNIHTRSWMNNDIEFWPYSGALAITRYFGNKKPSPESEKDWILKCSLLDWKAAAERCRKGYDKTFN